MEGLENGSQTKNDFKNNPKNICVFVCGCGCWGLKAIITASLPPILLHLSPHRRRRRRRWDLERRGWWDEWDERNKRGCVGHGKREGCRMSLSLHPQQLAIIPVSGFGPAVLHNGPSTMATKGENPGWIIQRCWRQGRWKNMRWPRERGKHKAPALVFPWQGHPLYWQFSTCSRAPSTVTLFKNEFKDFSRSGFVRNCWHLCIRMYFCNHVPKSKLHYIWNNDI